MSAIRERYDAIEEMVERWIDQDMSVAERVEEILSLLSEQQSELTNYKLGFATQTEHRERLEAENERVHDISETDLVLLALRASCADVCSYAVNGAPGTGCYGQCRRKLSDFDPGEASNTQVVVQALRSTLLPKDGTP